MSDEFHDPLRAMQDPGPACAQVVSDCERQRQQAEALEWLTSLVRWALIGYAASLWWDWRGCISALAVYALAARGVVRVGQLILCAKSGAR